MQQLSSRVVCELVWVDVSVCVCLCVLVFQAPHLCEAWHRHAVGALLSAVQRSSALGRHTGLDGVIGDGQSHVFSLQKVACAAALPMEAGRGGQRGLKDSFQKRDIMFDYYQTQVIINSFALVAKTIVL